MNGLVVLGFVFIYTQAAEIGLHVARANDPKVGCLTEKNLDRDKILSILENTELPQDDEELQRFFVCYYQKIGILNNSEEVNLEVFKGALPMLIQTRYGDIKDIQKLASDAIKHCEGIPRANIPIISAIRARNCAMKYVAEHKYI